MTDAVGFFGGVISNLYGTLDHKSHRLYKESCLHTEILSLWYVLIIPQGNLMDSFYHSAFVFCFFFFPPFASCSSLIISAEWCVCSRDPAHNAALFCYIVVSRKAVQTLTAGSYHIIVLWPFCSYGLDLGHRGRSRSAILQRDPRSSFRVPFYLCKYCMYVFMYMRYKKSVGKNLNELTFICTAFKVCAFYDFWIQGFCYLVKKPFFVL